MPRPHDGGEPSRATSRARALLLAALPYAVFALLAALSWNRWIEPYVDSGRELETPWRLQSGERLYRDVRFYHGPLAPYLAAAVDRAAGPSLPARIALSAAVALASLEALRRVARRVMTPGRASLTSALVVATCFFQRPGGCHLFPFSLDTAIAAAAIAWGMLAASGRQSAAGDWAAAAAFAAALLSRPEMGLAAVASLAVERRSARRLAVPAVVPLAAAGVVYAMLSAGSPFAVLRREGWLAILGPPQTFRNIYASYAGLDRPALRLAELALAAIVLLLLAAWLAMAAAAASRVRRGRRAIEAAAVAVLVAGAAVCLQPPDRFAPTFSLFPPLVRIVPPLLVAAALARVAARILRRPPGPLLAAAPDALLYTAALFAARLLLAAGYVGPYSAFLLPLPLTLAVAGLFRLADRGAPAVGARLPRLVAAALGVFVLLRAGDLARIFRHAGWARVPTPAGTLWLTEPVASTTRDALQDLSARFPSGGTLVGFPEGGFFNYVLRLSNPLPESQFFPGHLDAAAEAAVLARLSAKPPDALLYANVLAVGHGHDVVRFGQDYLMALDRAVRDNFEVAAAYGPGAGPGARVGDPQFFVEIRVPRTENAASP
ncbi:MAG TPA: hypothetical protein VMQ61_03660 [Thermoanaerobaculia bacterium]|nr:hypothetical protein [Thermoanaerobaculia bacterium]